ncbi:DEAD/DEAH box helicase [Desulfovibrio mangrovi]|uniref:DEAD/DEAH box helicase n=1 Tax=Desulfovibrio mangrovi TaxID=2976983 RepID=UPI0030843F72
MSFESFSFDRRIVSGIAACGYETPTPIQAETIPAILRGQDVLGLAQTGTGKTAAFALPILQHLINFDANRRGPVRVLVLAPTRELALQIQETFIALGKQTGYRCAAVFGGVGIVPQIKAMRSSSMAVACPGRLLDLAKRGECDLSQVDILVLDEADRMFDMGFLPDLRRILSLLPANRQNLLFSATMPSEIRSLAEELLRDPVTVQVDHTVPKASIEHVAYNVPSRQKTGLLQALLKETDHESVLIFTRTKHRAKNVARFLGEKGWEATALQGNLSQNRRQEALDGFRAGKYKIMVATDIAARGIDCSSISHVINYDVPDTAETYTHRIGRTGRAERTGMAMTLISGEDNSLMRSIERTLGNAIPRTKLEGFVCDQEEDGDFGRPNDRFPKRGGNRSGGAPRSGKPFKRFEESSEGARGSRQGFRSARPSDHEDCRWDNDFRADRAPKSGDRDFGRSMDRQRGGMRSPYADQLSGDAPRFGRAAKSPFAGKSDRADRFGKSDDKPFRKEGFGGRKAEGDRRDSFGRDSFGKDGFAKRSFGNDGFEKKSFGKPEGASRRFDNDDRRPAGKPRFERDDRFRSEDRSDRFNREGRFERNERNDRDARPAFKARGEQAERAGRFGNTERTGRSEERSGWQNRDDRRGGNRFERSDRDFGQSERKGGFDRKPQGRSDRFGDDRSARFGDDRFARKNDDRSGRQSDNRFGNKTDDRSARKSDNRFGRDADNKFGDKRTRSGSGFGDDRRDGNREDRNGRSARPFGARKGGRPAHGKR